MVSSFNRCLLKLNSSDSVTNIKFQCKIHLNKSEFEPTSAAAMEVVVGGQCAAATAGVLLALCCAAEANWNAADPEAEAAAVLEVVAVEAVADDEDVVAVEEEDCNARTRGLEGS